MRRHHLILPLATLIAVSPLLLFGTSCGHDIGFHLQNWVEAAAQLRHGTLYPRWAFSPAWQAGEPRFIFYPPLSWMFGALLTLVLPMAATPNAFIFVAILAAGYSMYRVAERFTNPDGALLAACVYLANPYMFFNAFERSAYAELLAAIWIPLLFLAVLGKRPSITAGTAGIALAWLTNVPAGIMATYTFVVLACVRLFRTWRSERNRRRVIAEHTNDHPRREMRVVTIGPGEPVLRPSGRILPDEFRPDAFSLTASLVLGITLPAFYLLPALNEKHFVQSSMLMIENLRYQDNFLFHDTRWEPHNVVTHTVSLLAVAMLLATAGVLVFLFTGRRRIFASMRPAPIALAVLFAIVLFLLLPISGFVWHITPELQFLQFPWRLLTVLSAVLALSVAIALLPLQLRSWATPLFALAYVAAMTGITSHLYRQACDIPHLAQTTLDIFNSQHGIGPTDEYTPGDADNDLLRTGSPSYWLAPPSDPSAYAPGTVPNPNEYDPDFDSPIPFQYTWAQRAPAHLDLDLSRPAVLILNLRDFPDWRITRNGEPAPRHIRRDDGLTAIPLPAGPSHIDIAWHRGWDIYAGDALSLAALCALFLFRHHLRDSERPVHVH